MIKINNELDSLHWFLQHRSLRHVLCARCVRCDVLPTRMALFTFCVMCRNSVNVTFWGLCSVHPSGDYDPQIRNRLRFLYNAPTSNFMILCLLVRKLSCWQTHPHANKQTPLKTPNTLRNAMTLGNQLKNNTYESLFRPGNTDHEAVRPSAAGKPGTQDPLGLHASS